MKLKLAVPLVLAVLIATGAQAQKVEVTPSPAEGHIVVAPRFVVGVAGGVMSAQAAYTVTSAQLNTIGISTPDWTDSEPPMTLYIMPGVIEGEDTWTTMIVVNERDGFPFIEYRTKDQEAVKRAHALGIQSP